MGLIICDKAGESREKPVTLSGSYSEPFSSSCGLPDAVVVKDGDGLAEMAGLAPAAT
jgi:hypothetical protein